MESFLAEIFLLLLKFFKNELFSYKLILKGILPYIIMLNLFPFFLNLNIIQTIVSILYFQNKIKKKIIFHVSSSFSKKLFNDLIHKIGGIRLVQHLAIP